MIKSICATCCTRSVGSRYTTQHVRQHECMRAVQLIPVVRGYNFARKELRNIMVQCQNIDSFTMVLDVLRRVNKRASLPKL